MKSWKIIPAKPAHIPAIAADMREADRREVWASHRHTPVQALKSSLACSELAWTCLVEDTPALMFGVARRGILLSDTGVPWLLGADLFFKTHSELNRVFLRQSQRYVALMLDRFPRLENYVHAGNKASIRWLKWCGFRLIDDPVTINGEEFYRFWRDARHV